MKNKVCCICGHNLKAEEGNNPWPVMELFGESSEDAMCCDLCNLKYVVALREFYHKVEKERESDARLQ